MPSRTRRSERGGLAPWLRCRPSPSLFYGGGQKRITRADRVSGANPLLDGECDVRPPMTEEQSDWAWDQVQKELDQNTLSDVRTRFAS